MYILLNKPLGMLTTLKDDRGRKHVGQLFKQLPLVKPIGRLDLNTTGVLLLTNDGELHYRLTHPRFQIIRIYQLKVRGKILPETVRKLRLGVRLDDGKIARVVLRKLVFRDGISTFQLELREGRYREIRRLMTALGYKLLSLDRVAYAGITASGLRRGDWRFLADSEIEHLHDLANTGVR
jgi:pseudouridine synthase